MNIITKNISENFKISHLQKKLLDSSSSSSNQSFFNHLKKNINKNLPVVEIENSSKAINYGFKSITENKTSKNPSEEKKVEKKIRKVLLKISKIVDNKTK